MTARPRIGLALGAGGARGWCHVGAVRALAGLGIRPDVVAGTSMGALVGSALAADRLDALEAWARGLGWRNVLSMVDVRLTGGGLVGGAGIDRALAAIGVPEDFAALRLPFLAVAADLATGEEVWLRDGPLRQAVRASVAIPGVFTPWRIGPRWLVDGGIVNPLPVSAARALGADLVIAVNPNDRAAGLYWDPAAPSAVAGALAEVLPRLPDALTALWRPAAPAEPGPPPFMETVGAAIDIMTERILHARRAAEPPDVYLGARLGRIAVLELHRAAEAIAEGERLVADAAPQIAAALAAAAGGPPVRRA
ncbi:MAG: patatin-like phospholipase family protein [Rhodobacteraceae bacterium]|nr:patatin-like phospholipase family protein [Paracoccaceae bacterium]